MAQSTDKARPIIGLIRIVGRFLNRFFVSRRQFTTTGDVAPFIGHVSVDLKEDDYSDFYSMWHKKNEELRKKYNIPYGMGQSWECFDGCISGCYKGCDRRCYACYIMHDINNMGLQ